MAKRKNQVDELKQLIEFMKGHNIRKLKTPKFQIEMGRPEDDAALAQQQEIDDIRREAAAKIPDEFFLGLPIKPGCQPTEKTS
jgi:hypothetical protein